MAVVIPTMGRPSVVHACLQALASQTEPPEEVVIVAGDDAPAIAAVIDRFVSSLPIRVMPQRAPGVVGARNDGWQATTTELVAFIDDDAVPDAGWCAAIRAAFGRSAEIAGVTGPTVVPAAYRNGRDLLRFVGSLTASGRAARLAGWYYRHLVMDGLAFEVARMGPGGLQSVGSNFEAARRIAQPRQADYLEACNMTLRRKVLAQANGFDTRYQGTGEWNEPDLAFRIRRSHGCLVYDPAVAVEHRPSQSGVFASRRATADRMHNYLRFYFRWMWRPSRAGAFVATVLMFNAVWLMKFAQTRDVRWLSGITATVTGIVRYGIRGSRRQD